MPTFWVSYKSMAAIINNGRGLGGPATAKNTACAEVCCGAEGGQLRHVQSSTLAHAGLLLIIVFFPTVQHPSLPGPCQACTSHSRLQAKQSVNQSQRAPPVH